MTLNPEAPSPMTREHGMPGPLPHKWLVYAGCQFLGWGGVAAFGWIMGWVRELASGEPQGYADQTFLALTCLAGMGATHILWIIIRRGEWLVLPPFQILIRYASALLVTSLVLSFVGVTFFLVGPPRENPVETFTTALMINSSLVGAWMAIYFLLHFYEGFHSARSEQALLKQAVTEGKLEALNLQLNPHFLFNALNSIRALIPPANPEARQALTLLASVLRTTLGSSEAKTVPFSQELELVRDYLAIEKIRFAEHLVIEERISPGMAETPIPPLVLLTLVENGIKHGVQLQEASATLAIRAEVIDGEARISVENPASRTAAESSLGLGLHNLRERLRLTFGARSSADLRTCAGGSIRAELRYPAG